MEVAIHIASTLRSVSGGPIVPWRTAIGACDAVACVMEMEKNMNNELETVEIQTDTVETVVLPTYIPTIEETFKASGAHRQAMNVA